jgi:uncharacterized protein (TIGR02453 family)
VPFPGFPPDARKFFKALKRNNDRDWFQPRKETFDSKIKAPMYELVTAINAELHKFAPEYINDPKKAVYRIYRDTRFSPDKTPYKTHLAAIFPRHGGEKGSSPGFYFHISGEQVGVAGGVYEPQPEHLYAIRSWLAENHEAFRKAIRPAEKLLGKLHGESLTRVPKGFCAEHPAADLLKMKRWVFWAELAGELAESPKLQGELVKRFKAMLPAMEQLGSAVAKAKKPAMIFLDD